MIVVIDPELKQLFFDRVMEMNGFSPYDATKWIESIAYGEKGLLVHQAENDPHNEIQKLKEMVNTYKNSWLKEKEKRLKMVRKMRGIDDEVESYLDEIEQYRNVLINSGLREYA